VRAKAAADYQQFTKIGQKKLKKNCQKIWWIAEKSLPLHSLSGRNTENT
jgi:hypothetical protein